jgi:hypothetical protein
MAGGYRVPKTGVEGLAARDKDKQRQIDARRSAAGLKNAIIPVGKLKYTDAAGVAFMQLGVVLYQADPDAEEIEVFGLKMTNAHGADLLVVAQTSADDSGPDPSISAVLIGGEGTKGDGADILNVVVESSYFGLTSDDVSLASDGLFYLTASPDGDGLFVFNLNTTSSAANVRINPLTSELSQVTSSLRYKQDVEDAEVDAEAFLKLRPRTWRDKNAVDKDPETVERHIGFIAEEVDSLGLPFVDYDDEGRPDSLQYDRFMAGAVAVMQKQADQIDALTARLDALEDIA